MTRIEMKTLANGQRKYGQKRVEKAREKSDQRSEERLKTSEKSGGKFWQKHRKHKERRSTNMRNGRAENIEYTQ